MMSNSSGRTRQAMHNRFKLLEPIMNVFQLPDSRHLVSSPVLSDATPVSQLPPPSLSHPRSRRTGRD